MALSRAMANSSAPSNHGALRQVKSGQSTLDAFFLRPPGLHQAPSTSSKNPEQASVPSNQDSRRAMQPSPSQGSPKKPDFAIILGKSPRHLAKTHTFFTEDELDETPRPPKKLASSPHMRRLASQNSTLLRKGKSAPSDELAERAQGATKVPPTPGKPLRHNAQEPSQHPTHGARQEGFAEEAMPVVKRKRGRPKGYRPSLMGRGPGAASAEKITEAIRAGAQLPTARTKLTTGKKRGRPPKAPPPMPREVYERLDPKFQRFICEWEGCKAELYNFRTLQEHVAIVHAQRSKDPHYRCLWGKCAAETAIQPQFGSAGELEKHLMQAHMPKVQWQAGDGPKNQLLAYRAEDHQKAPLPEYLFDKNGNQVTPSTRDQEEEDIKTYRARQRKLNALLLLREEGLLDEEDESGVEETEEQQ